MLPNLFTSIRRLKWCCALLGCCLLLVPVVYVSAQGGGVDPTGTGGRHSIQGRLVFPSGQRADLRLKVRLESSGGDLTVLSDMNGSFRFQSLRPGHYTVIIEGGDLYESVREPVFIESGALSSRRMPGTVPVSRPFNLLLYLRERQGTSSTKPGVLNAALAQIPKPAANLYLQALESAGNGDTERAIAQLNQALTIHPDFGLAFNQLGLQYLKRKQIDSAAEALKQAVKLLPDSYEPQLNYGIVLMNQLKFTEAEQEFRGALKKNVTAFSPHLYLGITLVNLRNYQEAETMLQKAVELGRDKAAQAHYYLGGLYWRARDYPRAAGELERYLQLEPKAPNAEKVRATIKDLRHKS
jgi:Tfp pilus assembly protein PilF